MRRGVVSGPRLPTLGVIAVRKACGLLFVLAAGLLIVASGSMAQDQPTGINVSGTAQVRARPDIAYVTFGVVTEDRDAAQAAQENARRTTAVIDAIVRFGITRADIETTQYTVAPIVDYRATPPVTTGYRVTNLIRVTVRDLTRIGPLIDTAIAAGANNVQALNFDVQDRTRFRQEAIALALRRAEADARIAATTLGVNLGRVTYVNIPGDFIPRPFDVGIARAEAAPPTPIIPGEVDITVSVTVVYSIL